MKEMRIYRLIVVSFMIIYLSMVSVPVYADSVEENDIEVQERAYALAVSEFQTNRESLEMPVIYYYDHINDDLTTDRSAITQGYNAEKSLLLIGDCDVNTCIVMVVVTNGGNDIITGWVRLNEIALDSYDSDISVSETTDSASATMGEKNALDKAHQYLDYTSFSYTGLINQLEYEGFSTEEATYAADNCGADWNEQAALKAQSYLDYMSFSRQGLIDQLIFDGFTQEQAEYGVTAVGY